METKADEPKPQSGEELDLINSGNTDVRSLAQNLFYSHSGYGKTEGRLMRWARPDAFGKVRFTVVRGENSEELEGYISRWAPDGQAMYVDVPDPDDPNKFKAHILSADDKIKYEIYERKTPSASAT